MSSRDLEVEEGMEVVRRTIVGGRPRVRRKRRLRVPIGIEKVLCRAAGDDSFRDSLLHNRRATLEGLAGELNEAEREILATVPPSSLTAMIGQIDLKKHSRGKFMRGVVAAALVAASSTAFIDCGDAHDTSKGIRPDEVIPEEVKSEVLVNEDVTRGAEPDAVFTDVVFEDKFATQGMTMDVVEEEDNLATHGISPDATE